MKYFIEIFACDGTFNAEAVLLLMGNVNLPHSAINFSQTLCDLPFTMGISILY